MISGEETSSAVTMRATENIWTNIPMTELAKAL